MSRQNISGAWVIPPHQVEEFKEDINYKKLITACFLVDSPSQGINEGKRIPGQTDEEFEIEELSREEWFQQERKKPFLQRDVRAIFKKK